MSNPMPAPQPPYMSASLFKSTIEAFADSVVPPVLDRHVLSNLSGADYSALISGLRFLRLVEAGGNSVKPEFSQLVTALKNGDAAYRAALLPIIEDAYENVVVGVDMQRGSLPQLEKAFKDAGVQHGQMMTKTVRFYIKTLQDCGMTLSPHMTKARRPNAPKNAGKTLRLKKVKEEDDKNPQQNPPPDTPPEAFERLPIPGLAGAFIQYPNTLTESNCDLFDAMVGVLRTYAKGRMAGKEQKR